MIIFDLKLIFILDDGGDDDVMPNWDTQFLHGDDNDLPYFDELAPEGAVGEEEDLLAATQGQLKRVRPENVNYAKRAKRVDVKKLKDSIWKELEDITIQVAQVCPFLSAIGRLWS